jgi:site-specific recombinase XerD/transposase-like protein
MEKKQLNLSDKLPLSIVPEQEIKCYHCGSKDYFFKEKITRKDGTKAKAFRCKQCHKEFRDNYKFKTKFTNKPKIGEYKTEHSFCPHCQGNNYKKKGIYRRKDGTIAQKLYCKNCHKEFSNSYQVNSLQLPLEGIICPRCSSTHCIKSGTLRGKKQYQCKDCGRSFILDYCDWKSVKQSVSEGLLLEEMYDYDVWDLTVLGYQRNPTHSDSTTANFAPIKQDWLKEACKRFIKFRSATLGLTTLGDKLKSIRDFSSFLSKRYPHLLPHELNRQVIEDYLVFLKEEKYAASTRIHKISALRELLQYSAAMNWVDVPKSPLIFTEDFPSRDRPLPRYIPDAVLKQLDENLQYLPDPIARMVIVVREVGMRISELCALKFDCLRQDAQGEWWIEYKRFKSKDEHSVPIRSEVAGIIQTQQAYIREHLGKEFNYLFCSTKNPSYFETFGRTANQFSLDYFKPIPEIIRQGVFRGYLLFLANTKQIKGEDGKIFPLNHIHQFRHTKGTELINNGVGIEYVRRYLGHNTFAMTLRYTHIHDRTLKEQVKASWAEGKIVNISGELIKLNPEIDNAYNYTFKKGILGEVLANGYCALPARLTCSKGNACLQCGDFRTTLEFLEQHKEHRDRTQKALEVAKTNNWQRQIQVNEDVLNNLNNIINSLEEE